MINRLKKLHKELGTVPTLSYLCGEILARCSNKFDLHHYHFYAQPVKTSSRVPVRKRGRYQFEWLDSYSEILDALGRPVNIIESRFKQGATCLVAKEDEKFLGCLWLVRYQYIEDEIRATYKFPDYAAWDFDVYVIPKKRLTPLFAILWDIADSWMIERGIHYSLSRINAHNQNSVRSHESAGAIKIGWAIAINFYQWQFTISTHAPRFDYSFSTRDKGPCWTLDPIQRPGPLTCETHRIDKI